MRKLNLKDNKGFTIIEVLIVLAIVGLIMLVIFLAVPALRRNSQNNSIKNAANNSASAYTEISSNKGGAVLTAAQNTNVYGAANLSGTDITAVSISATPPTAQTQPTSFQNIWFVTAAKCSSQDTIPAAGSGSTREVVEIYYLKSGSSADGQVQCVNV